MFWIKLDLIKDLTTNFLRSRDIVEFNFLLWLDWIEKWKYIEARQDQIDAKAKDQAQQY